MADEPDTTPKTVTPLHGTSASGPPATTAGANSQTTAFDTTQEKPSPETTKFGSQSDESVSPSPSGDFYNDDDFYISGGVLPSNLKLIGTIGTRQSFTDFSDYTNAPAEIAKPSQSVISELTKQLEETQQALDGKTKELQDTKAKLEKEKEALALANEKLQKTVQELELSKEKIKERVEEIADLKQQLQETEQALIEIKSNLKLLEQNLKSDETNRSSEISSLSQQLQETEQARDAEIADLKNKLEKEKEALELANEKLKETVQELDTEIAAQKNQLEDTKAKLEKEKEELALANKQLEEKNPALEAEKDKLTEVNTQLVKLLDKARLLLDNSYTNVNHLFLKNAELTQDLEETKQARDTEIVKLKQQLQKTLQALDRNNQDRERLDFQFETSLKEIHHLENRINVLQGTLDALPIKPKGTPASTQTANDLPIKPKVTPASTQTANDLPIKPKVTPASTQTANALPIKPKGTPASTQTANALPIKPKGTPTGLDQTKIQGTIEVSNTTTKRVLPMPAPSQKDQPPSASAQQPSTQVSPDTQAASGSQDTQTSPPNNSPGQASLPASNKSDASDSESRYDSRERPAPNTQERPDPNTQPNFFQDYIDTQSSSQSRTTIPKREYTDSARHNSKNDLRDQQQDDEYEDSLLKRLRKLASQKAALEATREEVIRDESGSGFIPLTNLETVLQGIYSNPEDQDSHSPNKQGGEELRALQDLHDWELRDLGSNQQEIKTRKVKKFGSETKWQVDQDIIISNQAKLNSETQSIACDFNNYEDRLLAPENRIILSRLLHLQRMQGNLINLQQNLQQQQQRQIESPLKVSKANLAHIQTTLQKAQLDLQDFQLKYLQPQQKQLFEILKNSTDDLNLEPLEDLNSKMNELLMKGKRRWYNLKRQSSLALCERIKQKSQKEEELNAKLRLIWEKRDLTPLWLYPSAEEFNAVLSNHLKLFQTASALNSESETSNGSISKAKLSFLIAKKRALEVLRDVEIPKYKKYINALKRKLKKNTKFGAEELARYPLTNDEFDRSILQVNRNLSEKERLAYKESIDFMRELKAKAKNEAIDTTLENLDKAINQMEEEISQRNSGVDCFYFPDGTYTEFVTDSKPLDAARREIIDQANKADNADATASLTDNNGKAHTVQFNNTTLSTLLVGVKAENSSDIYTLKITKESNASNASDASNDKYSYSMDSINGKPIENFKWWWHSEKDKVEMIRHMANTMLEHTNPSWKITVNDKKPDWPHLYVELMANKKAYPDRKFPDVSVGDPGKKEKYDDLITKRVTEIQSEIQRKIAGEKDSEKLVTDSSFIARVGVALSRGPG